MIYLVFPYDLLRIGVLIFLASINLYLRLMVLFYAVQGSWQQSGIIPDDVPACHGRQRRPARGFENLRASL